MKRLLVVLLILLAITMPIFAQGRGRKAKQPSLKVSAGASQTITLPSTATLRGSFSVVPAGTTVTLTWSKSSGPGTVMFSDATTLTTVATFSSAGTYIIKLTGTTGTLTSSGSTTVLVNAAPPANPDPVKTGWNANIESDVVGYNIYRSLTSGSYTNGPLNGTTPITGTAYTDFTVSFGHTYFYILRAVNTAGKESPNSTEISAVR